MNKTNMAQTTFKEFKSEALINQTLRYFKDVGFRLPKKIPVI